MDIEGLFGKYPPWRSATSKFQMNVLVVHIIMIIIIIIIFFPLYSISPVFPAFIAILSFVLLYILPFIEVCDFVFPSLSPHLDSSRAYRRL